MHGPFSQEDKRPGAMLAITEDMPRLHLFSLGEGEHCLAKERRSRSRGRDGAAGKDKRPMSGIREGLAVVQDGCHGKGIHAKRALTAYCEQHQGRGHRGG